VEEEGWLQKSQEILTEIKEWRRAHPKATFVQIEEEVHRRMMHLEAHVLQDAAQASPSREWARGASGQGPLCPSCEAPLQARGKQKRTLQGNGGESVTLSRTYGTCPKCGQGLFPPG
jgi:RNase P subunit RPR2